MMGWYNDEGRYVETDPMQRDDSGFFRDRDRRELAELHEKLKAAEAALTTARSEGFAAGAKQEREAIVKWLRDSVDGERPPVRYFGAGHVADGIERADHLPKEKADV